MKSIQHSFTKRVLLAGLIAGGTILGASGYAMSGGGSAGKPGCEAGHGQKIQASWEEHRAKHMAALKEKLKLTPEQEAAWNAFASAGQPAKRHTDMDRKAMRSEFEKLNTPQRLDKMLAMSDMRRAKMAERAETTKTFYAQLSPEQQSVFDDEAIPNRNLGHRHHRRHS
jgi:periplasmic protein CpxP/Spy